MDARRQPAAPRRPTRRLCAAAAIALLAGCAPGPAERGDPEMAARVREAFLHAWNGYSAHAWGRDQLLPLSRSGRDWHAASLLMTPLDAFDTALLMGFDRAAQRAKVLVLDRLSFDRDFEVQVFEVTIRLLGGLVTAYQMDGDSGFLDLARDLGDRLLPAFRSATGMPYRFVNLRSGAVSGPVSNPAEIATLMLEFGALSRITGDQRYYDAAKRAVVALHGRRSPLGLVGSTIHVETGAWVDSTSHVSGGIDSYYEYLLKSWLLFGDEDFRVMWDSAAAALHRHVADERPDGLWYGHVRMGTGERVATRFGSLDAFLPGVLALAGDRDRAGRLMRSVHRMWTTFGVEPEQLDYSTMRAVNPAYHLRPEAIESAYYLYRLTGDEEYREMGRVMVDSLLRATRVPGGFAALADVTTGERRDEMESFFLAETLKYAYLLFAPAGTLGLDTVVFNTEAHPISRSWR